MNTQNWTSGHILTEEEFESFYESVQLERVFVVAPQPSPGVAFSAPEGEVGIYRSQNGDFFEITDTADDESDQVCFLGSNFTQEQATELVIEFIQRESYETSVAVFFNFDPSRFEPESDLIGALPEYFWVRSSWLNDDSVKAINSKLLATNPIYITLAEFLNGPDNPKFTRLKHNVTTLMDFSSVYLTNQ